MPVALSQVTYTSATIPIASCSDTDTTIPGVRVGDDLLLVPGGLFAVGIVTGSLAVVTSNTQRVRGVNPTAGGLTPAALASVLANLRALPAQSISVTPASAAAATAAVQTITVPGLRPGDAVLLLLSNPLTPNVCFRACVVAVANTLPLLAINPTIAAIGAVVGTWTLINLRGLPMSTVLIAPGTIPANSAANVNIIVPGIMVGDVVLAIPPANLTAGVYPEVLQVAIANTLPIRIANPTAAGVAVATGTWTLVNLGRA